MRQIVEIKTVFSFAELSDDAKARAMTAYSAGACCDSSWYESVYDDAESVAIILGIDLNKRKGQPSIYFSGFSSQGDGACFESTYSYAKGAVKVIKAHAPQDKELHRIANCLQDVQRKNFYSIRASTKQRGFYNHSGCMAVEVFDNRNQYRDIKDAEDDVSQLLRDFADWIYKQLEKEYEYQTSEETAKEYLESSDYEFDAMGNLI